MTAPEVADTLVIGKPSRLPGSRKTTYRPRSLPFCGSGAEEWWSAGERPRAGDRAKPLTEPVLLFAKLRSLLTISAYRSAWLASLTQLWQRFFNTWAAASLYGKRSRRRHFWA
jgi:hypothetical protein